jgi:hypothetical protein
MRRRKERKVLEHVLVKLEDDGGELVEVVPWRAHDETRMKQERELAEVDEADNEQLVEVEPWPRNGTR